jgi:hypothetical protein
MRSRFVLCLAPIAALVVAVPSCGSSGNHSNGAGGPGSGEDGGPGSLTGDGSIGAFGLGDGATLIDGQILCDEVCPSGLVCDHGYCLPPQAACTSNAQCNNDTYCGPDGQCDPYGGSTTSDPNCALSIPPGAFAPVDFCDFKPAAADPFATYLDVQATPIVVNFNPIDPDGGLPTGAPSIVAPFTVPVSTSYTENLGVLRVLSGKDCSQQAALGSGSIITSAMRSSTTPAVGDLDGDGIPEIVAFTGNLSVVAFTLKAGAWKSLWPATAGTNPDGLATTAAGAIFVPATNAQWSAPSIHDLDNDGKPEVVIEGNVLNGQTGVVRAPAPADYTGYYVGIPPVVANMDGGATAQMTEGAHLWSFDPASNTWVDVPSYSQATTSPAGWSGVADFNPYDGLHQPEIAVASSSTVSVFNLDHSPFMGMSALPVPGGGGGPPTIADYDGDGLPEVGLAGGDFYTVFDPDCQGTPRTGGKCATQGTSACDTSVACTDDAGTATYCLGPATTCPSYVLWSRKTQDHSSNITGSSVFDFEASGTAQVVYADECFARVFDGRNGQVQFSQYHSSCTWLENPVVADVDGDYHAELVVMSNTACGLPGVGIDCGGSLDEYGVDSTFIGEQCQANSDCATGVCTSGYCRCTTTASCCGAATDAACIEAGLMCAPPPAGTPGTGNTCRAPHPHGLEGIRVFKDAKNRWVDSREIWNQHAYAVTNVAPNGTIPKTSAWLENWTQPGLNDFRQNVPGQANGKAVGDVTAQAGPNFVCSGTQAILEAPICNRGAAPLGAGIVVGFYVAGTKVCSATSATPLAVGQCEVVDCTWASPPTTGGSAVNVTVVANDGAGMPVCYQNGQGLVENVFCGQAQ